MACSLKRTTMCKRTMGMRLPWRLAAEGLASVA
jgi:hypothetical protein